MRKTITAWMRALRLWMSKPLEPEQDTGRLRNIRASGFKVVRKRMVVIFRRAMEPGHLNQPVFGGKAEKRNILKCKSFLLGELIDMGKIQLLIFVLCAGKH